MNENKPDREQTYLFESPCGLSCQELHNFEDGMQCCGISAKNNTFLIWCRFGLCQNTVDEQDSLSPFKTQRLKVINESWFSATKKSRIWSILEIEAAMKRTLIYAVSFTPTLINRILIWEQKNQNPLKMLINLLSSSEIYWFRLGLQFLKRTLSICKLA